jgi:acylphosphatase
MADRISKRVTYVGRVQGVGFRYTTQSLAASFLVAGWVRNEPDGSVELEVEGEPEQVTAFLDAIAANLGRFIETSTIREATPSGQPGFRIRR